MESWSRTRGDPPAGVALSQRCWGIISLPRDGSARGPPGCPAAATISGDAPAAAPGASPAGIGTVTQGLTLQSCPAPHVGPLEVPQGGLQGQLLPLRWIQPRVTQGGSPRNFLGTFLFASGGSCQKLSSQQHCRVRNGQFYGQPALKSPPPILK